MRFNVRSFVHCHCAALALAAACLGGPAAAGPVGTAGTFEGDAVGSFPAGWSDAARVDPASTAPNPSAVVVSTTDAFGRPTKALAPVAAIAPSKGIYRAISAANFYATSADVRIERFSDFDPNPDLAACGCPPGTKSALDYPMQIGFSELQGTTDLSHTPTVALLASARTRGWVLFAATENVVAAIDLGVPATLGTWYGLQLDLNAATGSVRSRITDVAAGAILLDSTTSLLPFGPWDPATDGKFDVEGFFGGEVTARTTPAVAEVDNIDTPIPEPATMLLLASALTACVAARRWK
jgi:hypothetical protein